MNFRPTAHGLLDLRTASNALDVYVRQTVIPLGTRLFRKKKELNRVRDQLLAFASEPESSVSEGKSFVAEEGQRTRRSVGFLDHHLSDLKCVAGAPHVCLRRPQLG